MTTHFSTEKSILNLFNEALQQASKTVKEKKPGFTFLDDILEEIADTSVTDNNPAPNGPTTSTPSSRYGRKIKQATPFNSKTTNDEKRPTSEKRRSRKRSSSSANKVPQETSLNETNNDQFNQLPPLDDLVQNDSLTPISSRKRSSGFPASEHKRFAAIDNTCSLDGLVDQTADTSQDLADIAEDLSEKFQSSPTFTIDKSVRDVKGNDPYEKRERSVDNDGFDGLSKKGENQNIKATNGPSGKVKKDSQDTESTNVTAGTLNSLIFVDSSTASVDSNNEVFVKKSKSVLSNEDSSGMSGNGLESLPSLGRETDSEDDDDLPPCDFGDTSTALKSMYKL